MNACLRGIRISTKVPETVMQNEVYKLFWTKEKREDGDWDFKEEIHQLTVQKQRDKGASREQIFAWILLVYHT